MKHFNSVEQILSQLEQQPGWKRFRDYRQLLQCWHKVVSPNTAQHTRILQITRQVLWVATSSAARAQELTFQRYALLKRLNKQLPYTLKDIRFSAAGWEQKPTGDRSTKQPILFRTSQLHKSSQSTSKPIDLGLKATTIDNGLKSSTVAKIAAQKYLTTIAQNSSSLSPCPNCGCGTPPQEIERWNLCYLCTAKKWSQEYRNPTFPELE